MQRRLFLLPTIYPKNTATGNISNDSNPFITSSGSYARNQPIIGNDFQLLDNTIAVSPTTDRMHVSGPYYTPFSFTVTGIAMYMEGGTASQTFRGLVYNDSGSSWTNRTITAAGAPNALVTFGTSEVLIAGSEAVGWKNFPVTSTVIASGTLIWGGVWASTAAANAQALFRSKANTTSSKYNTNGGVTVYSSVSNPPSTFPATRSVTNGRAISMYLLGFPTQPNAVTISSVLNATRSVALSWNIPANTTDVHITRQKSGGSEISLALLNTSSTAFTDTDLEQATYTYRAYAVNYNVTSFASATTVTFAAAQRNAYQTIISSHVGSGVHIASPERGLIKFENTPNMPNITSEYFDVFERIGVVWSALEPTQNNYNFSVLNNFFNARASTGSPKRKVAFRWRCVVPGQANNTPAYLAADTTTYGGVVTPNWNTANVINRMVALYTALGASYGNDTRIGFVDIGGYASYGEWADNPGGPQITAANGKLLIDAACTAFPNVPVLISAPSIELDEVIWYGLETYSNFGLRIDNLGFGDNATWLRSIGEKSERSRYRMQEKAPYFTVEHGTFGAIADPAGLLTAEYDIEKLGIMSVMNTNLDSYNALSAAGKASVDRGFIRAGYQIGFTYARIPERITKTENTSIAVWWFNRGNNRTAHNWTIQYQLRATLNGAVVWSSNSTYDVRTLRSNSDTATAWQDIINVTGVTNGTYKLLIRVISANTYTDTMRMFNTNPSTDYAYEIGSVIIQ